MLKFTNTNTSVLQQILDTFQVADDKLHSSQILSKSLVAKTIHCFSGVTIQIVVTGLGALLGSGNESVTSTSISTK